MESPAIGEPVGMEAVAGPVEIAARHALEAEYDIVPFVHGLGHDLAGEGNRIVGINLANVLKGIFPRRPVFAIEGDPMALGRQPGARRSR